MGEKMNDTQQKELMMKVLVLLEDYLDDGKISESEYMRMRSGVDAVLFECEQEKEDNHSNILRTSERNMEEIAINSSIVAIDEKDIKVNKFIDEEIIMVKQFVDYVAQKGKLSTKVFNKFLEAQKKVEKRILNKI